MKLLVIGDPHGCYKKVFAAIKKNKPEAVILLGDLGLEAPLEEVLDPILDKTEVWFIHGNHDTDTDSDYEFCFGSNLAHRNLHGKVVEISGLRVAGLGGVFRSKVWHPGANEGQPKWDKRETYMQYQPSNIRRSAQRYGGLPRQHNSSIWYEDVEFLSDQKADILVTHEAPSCHRHGFDVLDDLAFNMGVNRVFHGHHHEHYQDEISNEEQTIIVDGVGLAQCKNERGESL
ncbi:MAG: metallophosphoesterase [Methylophaga sp.]|nr:metallophosphoesterase [Methylophaga sp.]